MTEPKRGGVVESLSRALAGGRLTAAPEDLRPAAVLIPLLWHDDDWSLILTKRAKSLRTQPGDIAFPGGRIDVNDAGPLQAALRESHEEIRLPPERVRILGHLPQRETVTGYWLTAFVGEIDSSQQLVPNEEVAEILTVPVGTLTEDVLRIDSRRLPDGTQREIYHYYFLDHDIWGITGRLLHEILTLIRQAPSDR